MPTAARLCGVDYLWVALGGALGASARYAFGLWIIGRLGTTFPWHTALINVSGSFAIGLLMAFFTDRLIVDPLWRLFLVVGFLGGYTTFSSYTYELFGLLESGSWWPASLYVVGSSVLGLLAVYGGYTLGRMVGR